MLRSLRRFKSYYAVRNGLKPGIYTTWEECQGNIHQVSNSHFKKFKKLRDALAYLKEVYVFIDITHRPSMPYVIRFNKNKEYLDPDLPLFDESQVEISIAQRKTQFDQGVQSALAGLVLGFTSQIGGVETDVEKCMRLLKIPPYPPSPFPNLLEDSLAAHKASLISVVRDTNEDSKPKKPQEYMVYCDGASRGNPGLGGLGFVIYDPQKQLIDGDGAYLGNLITNNEAEYKSLIAALKKCLALKIDRVHVYMDSMLVTQQVKGLWKDSDYKMKMLLAETKELKKLFKHFEITHIDRALNGVADKYANRAIDQRNLANSTENFYSNL